MSAAVGVFEARNPCLFDSPATRWICHCVRKDAAPAKPITGFTYILTMTYLLRLDQPDAGSHLSEWQSSVFLFLSSICAFCARSMVLTLIILRESTDESEEKLRRSRHSSGLSENRQNSCLHIPGRNLASSLPGLHLTVLFGETYACSCLELLPLTPRPGDSWRSRAGQVL